MKFSLSTNWASDRHSSGEGLVDEALELGFDGLELGYNLTPHQAKGVKARLEAGEIFVGSVHAYSPVPVGAPHGYPELHLLASPDEDERGMAACMLRDSLKLAQEMNARAVVLHAGRVFLDSWFGSLDSGRLLEAWETGGGSEAASYQKLLRAAKARRTHRGRAALKRFIPELDKLLPLFEKAEVLLCLENLPSIEGFPDETEIQQLIDHFSGSPLRYWHDMGHGQVRANLAWCGEHAEVAEELLPITGGIHIHDCVEPDDDHRAPGTGDIEFGEFAFYGTADIQRVFEPSYKVKPAALKESLAYVREAWTPVN